MRSLKHSWPILIVLALVVIFLATDLHKELSWQNFTAHRASIEAFVRSRPIFAAVLYICVYAMIVIASIPGGVWFTLAGGFLFGTLAGAALAVVAASTGAVLLFLAARSSFSRLLKERAAPLIERVRPGLERDGFSYLLVLRLLPIVPFWLVNLAPAVVGMRVAPFAAATVIGIIPGTLVFASIGAGVGDVLSHGGEPDLSIIFTAPVLLPLIGLAALALLPIAWRWLKPNSQRLPHA